MVVNAVDVAAEIDAVFFAGAGNICVGRSGASEFSTMMPIIVFGRPAFGLNLPAALGNDAGLVGAAALALRGVVLRGVVLK